MKKIFFSIIVFLAYTAAQSQIINFPDSRLKLYLTTSYSFTVAKDINGSTITVDSNNDHELSYSEVERVYSLDMGGYCGSQF